MIKTLKNFEKDISKCSKCGLCTSVCPVFKLNPNECAVSKGKFIMLDGVIKGDLTLSKNINKYLDMCLKCGKCTSFCPSAIDAVQIFNTAKYEYTKGKFKYKIIHFLQNVVFKLIPKRKNINIRKQNDITIVYFKGCVNNIFKNTDEYIKKIFKNIPLNIIEPDFKCCGLPFLSEGNMEGFIKNAKYNSKLLQTKCDYIVTDCTSCEDTISDYGKYISNFEYDSNKSINWGDLIAQKNIKFIFNKPLKVTFHKPCHLKNDDFIKRIMNNCINIRYEQMENYDNCCGCAGSFILKNRELSKKLSKNKAKNIANTQSDYVITTCPACIIGLKRGLFEIQSKIKPIGLLEFLSSADEIIV